MIKELIKYAHKAKEAGLAISSSSNIIARVDKERFAISSSGTYLGELNEEGTGMGKRIHRGDSSPPFFMSRRFGTSPLMPLSLHASDVHQ